MAQCKARDGEWQCTKNEEPPHNEHRTAHNRYVRFDDDTGMLLVTTGPWRVLHSWVTTRRRNKNGRV